MNLSDYGRIVWRRGWIILLLAVLAAGGAYVLSKGRTPIYRSIQKVLIQPARVDLSLTESSKQLLSLLREYLDSTFIAEKVINNLKLDMTPIELKNKVTVVPDPLALEIVISVDLPDGDLANQVSKSWGEQLVLYRDQENQKNLRQDQVNALLQDNPKFDLLEPKPGINAAAGAILGVLIGAILVFVLEYVESSVVRRREDLEIVMNIPVLAIMPDIVNAPSVPVAALASSAKKKHDIDKQLA